MTEISIQNKIPIYSLFLIIIIICGNYFGELLPCRIQKKLKNSMVIKYIFLFLSLFFLVLYSTEYTIFKNFYQTIIIFLFFILLSRNTYTFFLFNCFLLFIIYLLHLGENNFKDKENLKLSINILISICSFLIIIGFILYFLQKKRKFKKKFNVKTFLLGKPICKYELS